jgi:adenylate cyclase class IV
VEIEIKITSLDEDHIEIFVEPKFPFEWFSIRKKDDNVILSYKHYYPENVEITTHCDEFETEVKSKEQLENIFSTLNFKKH